RVTGTRLAQICIGKWFESAGPVECRREFISDSLVLDEAVLTGRADRLFIEAHRVQLPAFSASDLGRHQRVSVEEILRAIVSPFAQSFLVGDEFLQIGWL